MMPKKQSSSEELTSEQKQFTESFETVGDILAFQIKRKKNKVVLSTLRRMREILEKLLLIRLEDVEKFDRLMLSKEYLKHYQENKENAQYALLFMPENCLVTFTAATNQLRRIHECAVESGNDEASRETAYNIDWLLGQICQYPGYDLMIEQLLRTFLSMTKLAAAKNDPSAFTSSARWYFDTIFEAPAASDIEFHLPYLEILDKYIFVSLRNMVLDANEKLFQALVYDLVNGSYRLGGVDAKNPDDYQHSIINHNYETFRQLNESMQIGKRINDLTANVPNTTDLSKLNTWIQDFKNIDAEVRDKVPHKLAEDLMEIAEQVCKTAVFRFKLRNVDDLVFTIGAFCIYAKRYDFVRYMWEFKQPSDSDSVWIGKDVVPETYRDVLDMYLRKNVWDMHRHDWHERHGSAIYYKRYFLLVLVRTVLAIKPDNEARLRQLQAYQLPNLSVHRLSDISHSSEELPSIANWLAKESDLLNLLNLEPDNAATIVEEVLAPFFKGLPALAKQRIAQIERNRPTSDAVKESFRNNVVASFYDLAKVRNVLSHYGLITDKRDEEYQGTVELYGLRQLSPKSAFFEDWHVHYVGWGKGFAEGIARGENTLIITKLKERSKNQPASQLDSMLSHLSNPDDYILLALNTYPPYEWRDWKAFIPKYEVEDIKKLPEAFCGQCSYGKSLIPVYQIYTEEKEKCLLLLNTNTMGHLNQLCPLKPNEDKSLQRDIFRIEISVFTEFPEMIDEYITKNAVCIQKYETIEEKRKHLEELATIAVHERFEYTINEEFEGYLFPLVDEDENQ
ncbi:MAG: hypothetical protein GX625_11085 [Clostridiaceae bacterium]|nr:hypothetical protein [Clostridiaceae bacterium]